MTRELMQFPYALKGVHFDLAGELARGAAAACDRELKKSESDLAALTAEVETLSAEASAFLARELATVPRSEIT